MPICKCDINYIVFKVGSLFVYITKLNVKCFPLPISELKVYCLLHSERGHNFADEECTLVGTHDEVSQVHYRK